MRETGNSTISGDRVQVAAARSWTTTNADSLEALVDAIPPAAGESKSFTLDATGISELDTLGAWLLERVLRSYRRLGRHAQMVGLSTKYQRLFEEVRHAKPEAMIPIEP